MKAASLSLKDATTLASSVLTLAGTDGAPAFATAAALVAAEADGIGSHGLSRLPGYADQVLSGKVDGRAVPVLEWTGQGSLRVDASSGFSFPAIARGLDAAALGRMRSDAVLINAARGGVVDEAVLARALRQGHLAAAMLDVFEQEPLPAGSLLDGLPNLILTPHIAGVTEESNVRVSAVTAANVRRVLEARR